jgi:hypothetical protein
MPSPELVFNFNRHPGLADNTWQEQMEGWPQVLTHSGPDVATRRCTRCAAMHYVYEGELYEIPHVHSRDECPFACTLEVWRGSVSTSGPTRAASRAGSSPHSCGGIGSPPARASSRSSG